MKRVAVLGSTGSIGRNTLEVIAAFPDRLKLQGVATHSNIDGLTQQIQRFAPPLAAVWEESLAQELSRRASGASIMGGVEGLTSVATHPEVDLVVVATSGRDALIPVIRAIQAGKQIALASKELLVMAGELMMRLVKEHGTTLIPIDSEHAAVFQCLQGVSKDHVERLVITGSGGPLWAMTPAQRLGVSREQVLAHPKWQMGKKITVDSATLMNKGLELIEARWLFDLPLERLQVVIHPEAAVHGLVELIDGTCLAQLAPCDMRLPIQYALSYPERWGRPLEGNHRTPSRVSLTDLGTLHFEAPDLEQFPCLRLAWDAARQGESACVALNGANDVAVQAYLNQDIAFPDLPRVIAEVLGQHTTVAHPRFDEVLAIDAWARSAAHEVIHSWSLR